jgi:hypothetical protein
MKRHLLSVIAVAAFASFAGAQEPAQPAAHGDSMSAMHAKSHTATKHKSSKARRYTSASGGEVDLSRGGPGYSLHATSRDLVGADDTHGDALWRREQMMDAKCGKSRERCGRP